MTQWVVNVVNTTNRAYPKGICHLHKFLLKNGEALTQAGSLIIGYLRIIRHKLLIGGSLRRLLQGKILPNRFRGQLFCAN